MVYEIWILKTPGGEFIEYKEPMNYDWKECRKTKFVDAKSHGQLQKECDGVKELLRVSQSNKRNILNLYEALKALKKKLEQ